MNKIHQLMPVALGELGDVQVKQGDLAGALASYRKNLDITKRLAARDAGNAEWQRDLIPIFATISPLRPASVLSRQRSKRSSGNVEKTAGVFLAGLMGRRSASWKRRLLGRRKAAGGRG